MPLSATTLSSRFAAILAESPGRLSVTVGSETHYGHRTQERREMKYLPEGKNADTREQIVITVSDWTTMPAARGLATIAGTQYRILAVRPDTLGVTAILEVGPRYGA